MSGEGGIKEKEGSSFLFGGNSAYLEELFETYLEDPDAVSEEWRQHFDGLPKSEGGSAMGDVSYKPIRETFLEIGRSKKGISAPGPEASDVQQARKQSHVLKLIDAFRSHGHHQAKLDPLGSPRQGIADLELGHHGLSKADLDDIFDTNSFLGTKENHASLRDILAALHDTYCGSIGIEFMHITDIQQTKWIQQRVESIKGKPKLKKKEQQEILNHLTAAEGLEKYLARKYVGQKRFSVEGAESLVPLLNDMVQGAGRQGIKELVVGMAHRGRLNVLVNVLGKPPSSLFGEFEGSSIDESRSGDVKYHMGFSSDIKTAGGELHLTLGFNPSHLEIISPVIEGSVRARQERRADYEHEEVLPISIHGDAAFAGQGVVMETFNMSQARGYRTGGTVHIVINNQIGFTTSNPLDARSTLYCTDVAKMVQAPILHVNGDDPDAVIFAGRLALDFRMTFKKDIVIDLVTYRRHGHNESDDPTMTQPLMYQKIKTHPTTPTLYAEALVKKGVIASADVKSMEEIYRKDLDAGHSVVDLIDESSRKDDYMIDWDPYLSQDWNTTPTDTTLTLDRMKALSDKMQEIPVGFTINRQVGKEYQNRQKMMNGELPLNWGFAETMAYASILEDGYPVRISGQDSCRGTFSHRHAVLHDAKDGNQHVPLQHVSDEQAKLTIIDSCLSEEAVMGFEYGYATADPHTFVIWEGQFGDFANGAQVVIDQFISSGFQKWGRLCGLTLLLPHGYEGMGPEHSSARLERYLQLCAQHNMQVCIPSTPAQCFHMLRRQMLRPYRKPLIVMTPKSLLRHKLATSTLKDLTDGEFQVVIPEIEKLKTKNVKRVVLCSGKVYYDLLERRREEGLENIAILRVEQLYPFPHEALEALLEKYAGAKEVVWCQEEPENQGAWYPCRHNFKASLAKGQRLRYAGREAAAAPACGYLSVHVKQQKKLVEQALGLN